MPLSPAPPRSATPGCRPDLSAVLAGYSANDAAYGSAVSSVFEFARAPHPDETAARAAAFGPERSASCGCRAVAHNKQAAEDRSTRAAGSSGDAWLQLHQELAQFRRNERLLQDRPPRTGQETVRRNVQGISSDERGALT
jgi:hypothetical protein